ncbi:hypothetical protein CCOS865_04648 [Pseudomonas reidholzensis]|uniref:Peptidase S8/S53 domain-containing protein n=1 Tax=Pseudomonas reidholzensis TaxID=1785162 RepID=A0A383S030_9PSED|nr:S8 family serine peptidase [Pseudomonas reidholzensis]SYX92363.1 hypothetical protein CCOS865_04648 [Pseudomonas reidholzensis]
MIAELRIGVIDSGCSAEQAVNLTSARRFWLEDGVLREGALLPDQLGHGTAVVACLQHEAGTLPLLLAQVFHAHGSTSALQVAAALLWLVEQGVRVVNLSLGLQQDRPVLRQACAEAQAAGVLLCASSPARGAAVYPASYPGVVRITGDARCSPGQWSWLGSAQADFGGYVGSQQRAGASMACAALSGRIASMWGEEPQLKPQQLLESVRRNAVFAGPERRGAEDG